MRKLKTIFIIIAALFALLWGIRIYNGYRHHAEKETRFMMDTYVTIYAIGHQKVTSKAVSLALDRMQQIDVKFNSLNPKSPIYAFNHQSTPISDAEILNLVRLAINISKESGGAFDITVAPLVELWGFYGKSPHLPQEQEIKDVLKKVGYQHLLLNNGKLEKDSEGVAIDLGGIAKGYAISEAAKVLKAQGITQAVIDAGGDIYALGKRGKKLWKIGIRNPRSKEGSPTDAALGHIEVGEDGLLGYVEVDDLAVVGSGDYERFFIKKGKRYHHIFNSSTGYPTEGVSGVTLIYSDPVLAQALTKIPFIMGPKKGLGFLEKIPGMEAIIVTTTGEILYSSGLKHSLKNVSETK